MNQYGVQLYTVRDYMKSEEDIRNTFFKLKKMGYDQIQTAGCAISYERYGELAQEAGLEIVGTHDNFNMMKEQFETALKNHQLLHTTNMGIGGMSYQSQEDVLRFIDQANSVAEEAAKYGMKFTYHNHSHEFYRWENGKTTMDMLVDGLNPETTSFVLDTYWVQHGGGDVRHWIEKLQGRIDILHLKDMKRNISEDASIQQITEVGNGNLYWEGILATARKNGVKYFVVEQDENWEKDCFSSLEQSLKYLRELDLLMEK